MNRPSGLAAQRRLVGGLDEKTIALRFDGKTLSVHADLSELASHRCNDMVVDPLGRAYVGNFGFDLHAGEKPRSTVLVRVDPDGTAKIVADDVFFSNSVITADGRTLIVGETFARALTAFDIDASGDLSNNEPGQNCRRVLYPMASVWMQLTDLERIADNQ